MSQRQECSYGKLCCSFDINLLTVYSRLNLLVPPAPNCDEPDSEQLIRTKAFAAGVLAVPGLYAFPLGRVNSFVRVSFSLLEQDDMDEACRRLANVIRSAG